MLTLLNVYPKSDVLTAMQRAVTYRAFGYSSLERILAHQGPPKPSWQQLSESEQDAIAKLIDSKPIPPRHSQEYQDLLFGKRDESTETAPPELPSEKPQHRIKNAGFPTSATLESFDWEFNAKTINKSLIMELACGEFIKRRDNLAWAGQSGLGKSHLIQGIGRDWTEYMGDPALVMALLDRVSDNAIAFRFEGKSYRKSRTKQMS